MVNPLALELNPPPPPTLMAVRPFKGLTAQHIYVIRQLRVNGSIFKLCTTKYKIYNYIYIYIYKTKLRGLSPHANYTDRAATAGRRS